MKKRLLLFAAVLTASANFMFAETKTVQDSNGNTFSYDTKRDLDASSYGGDTVFANPASISIAADAYQLTVNSDQSMRINNCVLTYNVKLTGVSTNPGTIAPFTQHLTSSAINHDITVQPEDFVTIKWKGRNVEEYLVEENEAYYKYVAGCERAMAIRSGLVCKGSDLLAGNVFDEVIDVDDDGVDVVSSLYYMLARNGKLIVPILEVVGVYSEGITYSGSTVTYNPVGIADDCPSYEVTGDGKIGYVSGVVDNGKIEDILANTSYTYLNYDFSNASVLGTVATNIEDNRVAYFNEGVVVENNKGQNIVVDLQCKNYVISDNGQEIYVSTAFAAKNSQYKRALTADTYGTIVLPFSVGNTTNIFVKQAKLTSYIASENKLTFTSTEMIAPNTPYMFKVLPTVTGESIFSGQINGTVEATPEEAKSAKFEGAQFIGTFEGLPASAASQVYVVGSQGKIGRTQKPLKPGRCYLTREDNTNAKVENATIEIIDEDGSTEIVEVDETVTAIEGVENGEVVSVQYISVDGQISSEPFNGINLVKKTFEDGSFETSKVIF